jgi:hypothetical protein
MAISFGGLLRGASAARQGHVQGKRAREGEERALTLSLIDREARRVKEAAEMAKLGAETSKLTHDAAEPYEYKPRNADEYLAAHPHNIDPLSDEGIRRRLDAERRERALGPKPSAETSAQRIQERIATRAHELIAQGKTPREAAVQAQNEYGRVPGMSPLDLITAMQAIK